MFPRDVAAASLLEQVSFYLDENNIRKKKECYRKGSEQQEH